MVSREIYSKPIIKLHPILTLEKGKKLILANQRQEGKALNPLRKLSKTPETSRAYTPGDPIKLIDWRAYARTGELNIRQERKKNSLQIALILDANDSMLWPDEELQKSLKKGVCSKFYFALFPFFHLLYQNNLKGNSTNIFLSRENRLLSKKNINKSEALKLYGFLRQDPLFKEEFIRSFKEDKNHKKYFDKIYFFSDFINPKLPFLLPKSKFSHFIHTLSSLEIKTRWLKKDFLYYDKILSKKKFSGASLIKDDFLEESLNLWLKEKKENTQREGRKYTLLTEETKIRDYLKAIYL